MEKMTALSGDGGEQRSRQWHIEVETTADGGERWLAAAVNGCFMITVNSVVVFVGDIYGEYVISCAGIIGIKHRHNVVFDALIDICFWSGILVGKEVDIGLGGGRDKPLRPADMLFYSWHGGLDVCADLTGSSPLTQTGMTDFVHG
ncbi:hypothetical protein Tco_0189560 [Tanacetum coccineum]